MNFGNRLKYLRIAAGLTQEALAEKLGIKKQTISRYENSDREPNIRTAKCIADALGVTLEELVYGNSPGDKKEPAPQDELSDIDKQFMDILSGMSEAEKEKLLTLCKVYGIESISDLYGICSPGPALSSNESTLLSGFRDLNEEGQEKVLSYVEDLNRAGIYKRDSKTGLVQDS